jgi:hypothetical protein
MDAGGSKLSPGEKHKIRYEAWLSRESETCVTPEAKELFKAREKRIEDSIGLNVPDRVPISLQGLSFFPAAYCGVTFRDMMYDSDTLVSTYKKTIVDFAPDTYWGPAMPGPGKALEILDCKQLMWPGGNLQDDVAFQYKEDEYMKADEYDAFIADPTDYALREYLPRTLGICQSLTQLPHLFKLVQGYMGLNLFSALIKPELVTVFEKLYQAGVIMQKHNAVLSAFRKEMTSLGFPHGFGASSVAPFDVISDTLRGMRGVMLDMYRQPHKLLEAIEKITPNMVSSLISDANASGYPRARLVVHRAADAFMSEKQWETFYWPGFKRLILACIEEGITPMLFCEGDMTSRLKYFAELPRGKVVAILDSSDATRAREILGGKVCICGLMPLSVLQTGTPDEVRGYTRRLIDMVGRDGGFIIAPRSSLDAAKPDLVKVWVDCTKEYGVYK